MSTIAINYRFSAPDLVLVVPSWGSGRFEDTSGATDGTGSEELEAEVALSFSFSFSSEAIVILCFSNSSIFASNLTTFLRNGIALRHHHHARAIQGRFCFWLGLSH